MKDKKPTILVVDENPMFLRVWEKVFRSLSDCHYCLTNDPKTAIAIIKERHIDFLISEIVMNNHTGYDLAELAHTANPKAQIVLTTTYDCDLTRFNLNNPQFHILYKPYHKIDDVIHFIVDLMHRQDPRGDLDEESWSANTDFPSVTEWKL